MLSLGEIILQGLRGVAGPHVLQLDYTNYSLRRGGKDSSIMSEYSDNLIAEKNVQTTNLAGKFILVTGHCKSPSGTALNGDHDIIGVALEIDLDTDIIVDADFTFITELTRDFFRKMLIGYDLKMGLEPLREDFNKRFFVPSRDAIFMAIKAAVQRYFGNTKK